MIYVLIILFVGYNKAAITTQEFNSVETCLAAKEIIASDIGSGGLYTTCVKK